MWKFLKNKVLGQSVSQGCDITDMPDLDEMNFSTNDTPRGALTDAESDLVYRNNKTVQKAMTESSNAHALRVQSTSQLAHQKNISSPSVNKNESKAKKRAIAKKIQRRKSKKRWSLRAKWNRKRLSAHQGFSRLASTNTPDTPPHRTQQVAITNKENASPTARAVHKLRNAPTCKRNLMKMVQIDRRVNDQPVEQRSPQFTQYVDFAHHHMPETETKQRLSTAKARSHRAGIRSRKFKQSSYRSFQ